MHPLYKYLSNYLCEPTTSITDVLLAIFAFYCYSSISTSKFKNEAYSKWGLFFLFLSLATLIGGIAHGISCIQDHRYYMIFWVMMQIFSGISIYSSQQAVIVAEIRNENIKKWLTKLSKIQFFVFLICVFVFLNFRVLAINSAIGLVQMIILCLPTNNRKYKGIVSLGFWISFFTIYVNQKKIYFSYWFNHNDISHVIMFLSVALIFSGVNSMQYYNDYKNNNFIRLV
jgi:hypothetical protein